MFQRRKTFGIWGGFVEIEFPIEFLVHGTPASAQAGTASREDWKALVRAASKFALSDFHVASANPMSVTLFYWPEKPKRLDVDNMAKPILDALNGHVYIDDRQVERLVAQRFEPGGDFIFASPSDVLRGALAAETPVLYVRVSDNPFEDLK